MPFFDATTNTRAGVPLAYKFTLNGTTFTTKGWDDRLLSLSPVTCKAEPLDGQFSVGELSCDFADTDGSIWGAFGKGTTGLGFSFSATALVGGSMAYAGFGPKDANNNTQLRLQRTGTVYGQTYPIHQGEVYSVSRKGRVTTVTSKNVMRKVGDMQWMFPVYGVPYIADAQYGTNFVFTGSLQHLGTTLPASTFQEDGLGGFKTYAYVGSYASPTVAYPAASGRGTLGVAGSLGYYFVGTQFYFDYVKCQFEGTYYGSYLGSLIGTIKYSDDPTNYQKQIQDADNKAQDYGFPNHQAAWDAVVANDNGTFTVINRTRIKITGGSLPDVVGSALLFQQTKFVLEDTPANLWNELLTGQCVTPYFSATTIDSNSYGSAQAITAYQTYRQTIDPKGGTVLPYLKDLLAPLQGLFSVGQNNKLRLHLWGPRTLAESLGTISQAEVIDTSVSSSIDDVINHVTLAYSWDSNTGSFLNKIEIKGSLWNFDNDFPLDLTCQWITGDNDARITTQRIINRFNNGAPRLSIDVPLNRADVDIGSIIQVTDPDQAYQDKPFQVVSWSKDFSVERKVILDMMDADSLYKAKGYARFEDGTLLTETVTGTSTSGWGTNGTTPGINMGIYGAEFVWW